MTTLARLRFLLTWKLRWARQAMHRVGPGLVLVVGAVALLCFLAAGLTPLRALWETLAIFALGGEPDAVAHLAQSTEATDRTLDSVIWALRVGGPLLLGGALLDFAVQLLPEPQEVPATISQHVIVVGAGDLGRHLAESLTTKRMPVVVVDKDPHADHLRALRRVGMPVLFGDARQPDVLLRAGVERARAIVVATGDDALNESVALLSLAVLCPQGHALQAVAHVDGGQACRDRANRWLPPDRMSSFHAFDAYEHAARTLVRGWRAPDELDLVLVVGCGRFGRAVLAELRVALATRPEVQLLAVDRDPEVEALVTARAPSAQFHPWDVLDVRLAQLLTSTRSEAVGFVCTDDDARNIVFTKHLRDAAGDARLQAVTRLSDWPEDRQQELEQRLGQHVRIASFVHLLQDGLNADMARWLAGPPGR